MNLKPPALNVLLWMVFIFAIGTYTVNKSATVRTTLGGAK